MATPAEVAAYRASQQDVVALATADLAEWWANLDVSDARAAVAALEAYVPELVAAYGDMAATVAADWYDALREQAQVPGRYRAVLGDVAPAGQAQVAARWAAGPLFGGNPQRALSLLAGSAQRLVQQGGRHTLRRNTVQDPSGPRWARAPGGSKPCAWCRMLASRGAVYLSRKSAGGGVDNDWHDECNCQPVPVWGQQELPYDADALYQQYADARAAAGSGDPKAIAAQMRKDLGVN